MAIYYYHLEHYKLGIFYVGFTKNIRNRLRTHRTYINTGCGVSYKMREYCRNIDSKEIRIITIEQFNGTWQEILNKEKEIIKSYLDNGHDLVNCHKKVIKKNQL